MASHPNDEKSTEAKAQEVTDHRQINDATDSTPARNTSDQNQPHPSRSRPSNVAVTTTNGASPKIRSRPDHPGAVLAAMGRWAHHPPHRYPVDAAGISNAFSPPRMAKVPNLRATNVSITTTTPTTGNTSNANMDPENPNDHSLPKDFTVDLENVELPHDVLNMPVHSFSEDSPPRGQSADSDEDQARRSSPSASPILRQPPMPLYRDAQHSFPAASPPHLVRRAPDSQYAYFPDTEWSSPPFLDPHSMLLGDTPRRSPIHLSSPARRSAESAQQHTPPQQAAPFPFEPSPTRDVYDSLSLNTPKGTLGEEFALMGYDDHPPLGIAPDSHYASRGSARPQALAASSAPHPSSSPFMSGLLQQFAPSPPATTDRRRASDPYARYNYTPYHYQQGYPPPPGSLYASPVTSQPRRLWEQDQRQAGHVSGASPNGTSSAMRFGNGGHDLEGINRMMRAEQSSSSRQIPQRRPTHPPYSYHHHYYQHHQHLHHSSRMPRQHHLPLQQPAVKSATPLTRPADARHPFRTSEKPTSRTATSERPRPPTARAPASRTKVQATGKENTGSVSTTKSVKRSPCNCKKSKCLKLYCECFAAERFCNGCNCVDCCNTVENKEIRDKAIKETRSKNPNAFLNRINRNSDNPTHSNHSMGCRCKKSECLKKYCECFEAGVFCGGKCKCTQCSNFAGSQKLIDKRRKMKDAKGAEIAMRAAEAAWKSQSVGKFTPSQHVPTSTTPIVSRRMAGVDILPNISPPSRSHSQIAPRPQYSSFVRFSPMGVVTPAYRGTFQDQQNDFHAPPSAPQQASLTAKRSANKITPSFLARTPAVRLQFDPSSYRKKRKKGDEAEATFAYFGPNVPEQPKTTALAVFSFLSNEDAYSAALVSKTWKSLAEDGELWRFT